MKSWLIWKDPDAGKVRRREEKGTTEDEMASLTQWTWVWVNSGSWWWIGRPGVLQSMGVTESQTWLSDWTDWPTPVFLHGEFGILVAKSRTWPRAFHSHFHKEERTSNSPATRVEVKLLCFVRREGYKFWHGQGGKLGERTNRLGEKGDTETYWYWLISENKFVG